MAENKTKPTNKSVETFLNKIADERTRRDCFELVALMKKITKAKPVMWGPSIVGFGSFHYKNRSGTEGDTGLTGFSPRKQYLTIYVATGLKARPDNDSSGTNFLISSVPVWELVPLTCPKSTGDGR